MEQSVTRSTQHSALWFESALTNLLEPIRILHRLVEFLVMFCLTRPHRLAAMQTVYKYMAFFVFGNQCVCIFMVSSQVSFSCLSFHTSYVVWCSGLEVCSGLE